MTCLFPPRAPRHIQRGDPEYQTTARPATRRRWAAALATALGLLGATSAQAQVSTYSFAVSTTTYTDLGTSGTAITVANNDDATSAALPIGFNFTYNGSTFTRFMLNTNGFIKLGVVGMSAPSSDALFATSRTGSTGNVFSSTNAADDNIISATNTDWNAGVGGTEYRYLTTGTMGSRTLTVQWKNVGDDWGNQQYQAANFQIILTEGTNTVQIKHGTWTVNAVSTSAFVSTAAGLKGVSGNVRSISRTSGLLTTSATASTATTTLWSIAKASTPSPVPVNGTTYTFTPPAAAFRSVTGVTAGTAPTTNVEKGSTDNVILRADIATTGNTGTLTINSVDVTTANTNATVSAVKLWYSSSTTFSTSTATLLGTASAGNPSFTSLTQTLPLALSYLYVTFDIAATATIGQTIDASIQDLAIVITGDGGATGSNQPATAINSAGTRTIAFCSSGSTTPATDEDIGRVRFAGIDNAPGGELPVTSNTTANNSYTDFTSLTGTVRQGEPYLLTVNIINKSTSVFTTYVTAFVDFNQNGSFNDAGEQIFNETVANTTPATVASRQAQAVVTIPATATLGSTRLRIVASETAPQGPCTSYSWGETEDYTLNVLTPPACPSPSGFAMLNVAATTAQATFALGTGGGTAEIEYGPAGFTPGSGTIVSGLLNANSPYTITGLSPQTSYAVYVRRDCGGTQSSRVGPLSFTTSKAPMPYDITRTEGITYASIRGASTPVPFSGTSADDQLSDLMAFSNTAIFPSGFGFTYNGAPQTGLLISTNGWLTFNTAETANRLTNDLDAGSNIVAPFWDDLIGPSLDSMRYALSGSAGSQVLTIEWMSWRRDVVTGSLLNMQVKLYEATGRIEFVYGTTSQFDGSGNGTTLWSYSLGLNGSTPATEIASQQVENTADFQNEANDNLRRVPACNSMITFVPGTYTPTFPPAPMAPVNDNCAAAIQVPVGQFPAVEFCTLYTTALATTSAGAVPACTAATPGTADDDVWFTFTVPGTGPQDITVRVANSYNFDAVLQVFSGTCGAFTAINCVNGSGNGASESVLATGLPGGQTYHVRVYHAGTGSGGTNSNGTFALDVFVTPPVPANDEPTGAIAIGGATCTPISGTTLGATATGTPANTCTGTADDDVWYSVVLSGANNSIEVSLSGAGSFNAVLGLYSGAPTTSVQCANATTSGLESLTRGNLTAGTYYVRVHSLGALASNQGNFTICARTFVSVPNDECAGAVSLPINATCVNTTGTTVNATGSTAPLPPTCSVTTPVNDVWYTVTGVTNLRLTVTGANFNPVVQLMTSTAGCAGTFTNVLCRNVSTTFSETLVRQGLDPMITYYVRVQGAFGEPNGAFTICAQEVAAPANDNPAGAITLAVGPTGCASPTAGTTVLSTATPNVAVCSDISGGTPDDDVWYKFTPTISGPSITVQQDFSADLVVQLLREDPMNPGSFLTLQCVDDNTSGVEQLDANGLTPGQLYYIRVYSFGTTATTQGDFTICVSQQAKTVSTPRTATQASTVAVPQGSVNAPILRIQLRVVGGVGTLPLQSLTFGSNNTSDADLATNGVKLWISPQTSFDPALSTLIAIRNFSGGTAVFSGLNYNLPGGTSYLYLTYNVKSTATLGNVLDAQVLPNLVTIGGVGYTLTAFNPTGSRTIVPPAPANDEPCNAPLLIVQTGRPTSWVAGTTSGALNSAPTIVGSCKGLINAEKDVYYRVVVPASGELNVELRRPTASTIGDTRLYLYSYASCSGPLTVLDCDDDDGENNLSSIHTIGLTPGAQLMLRVAMDLSTDPAGAFEIAVTDRIVFTGAVSNVLSPTTVGNFFPTIEPATVSVNEPNLTTVLAASVVRVPANATTMPTVSGNVTIGGLDIRSGATLTQTANTLTVNGSVMISGTFVPNAAATLALGTTAPTTLSMGTGTRTLENLTVGNSGVSLQGPGKLQLRRLLTLDGVLTTNGNSLTLLSDAAGTAMVVNNVGGSVNGTVTVQRYLDPSANPDQGYRHFSTPVTNTTVADFTTRVGARFIATTNPAYNSAPDPALPGAVVPFPNVFGYDDSRVNPAFPVFERGYFSPGANTDPLVPGRGYSLYIDGNAKLDFVGSLGNGDVTVPVQNTNGLSTSGWNLLGNPYPAPLDWDLVAPATLTAAGLNTQVSVFKSEQPFSTAGALDGVYLTYANGMGSLTNGLIPMAQGFFVRHAAVGSSSLTMTNAMRATTYANPSHFRSTTTDTRPMVQLAVRHAGRTSADRTTVYFENGATDNADRFYDGYKIRSTGSMPSVFTLTPNGDELAVNGLPALDPAATTVVPLGVAVTATGSYKLDLDQLANVPAGVQVQLRDALTGTRQDLLTNPSYAFSMDAGFRGPRFSLVFNPAAGPTGTAATLADATVQVYPNPVARNAELRVVLANLPATAASVRATLLDNLGRVVSRTALAVTNGTTDGSLSTAGLAPGVYSLRVQAGSATTVRRVVVE